MLHPAAGTGYTCTLPPYKGEFKKIVCSVPLTTKSQALNKGGPDYCFGS
jgi:hypothetical protein